MKIDVRGFLSRGYNHTALFITGSGLVGKADRDGPRVDAVDLILSIALSVGCVSGVRLNVNPVGGMAAGVGYGPGDNAITA